MPYLWHARVAKKNNVAFYKIVSAFSKEKQHLSLEESCREGYNIAFFEGANTLRQTYFLYNKVLLKQSIFEKYMFYVRYHF